MRPHAVAGLILAKSKQKNSNNAYSKICGLISHMASDSSLGCSTAVLMHTPIEVQFFLFFYFLIIIRIFLLLSASCTPQ